VCGPSGLDLEYSKVKRALGARVGFSVLTLLGVFFALIFLLLLSPLTRPALEIEIGSSDPGFSQVFVAVEENAFSEEASTWAPVTGGPETLRFSLSPWRGTVGEFLRWDPLDRPGEMSVTGLTLTSAFARDELDLESLSPSMGMGEILIDNEVAYLILQSNDPQALIQAGVPAFVSASLRWSVLVSSGIALVAGIATFVMLGRRRQTPSASAPSNQIGASFVACRVVRVPKLVAALFGLVGAVGVFLLIAGSRVIGISWDEPTHESSLGEFFRSGLYAPRWSFADGVPTQVAATVYAPFGDVLGHALGAVLGTHAWFTESYLVASYEIRHFVVALISVAGFASAALVVRFLLQSWSWAVVGLATVVSIPLLVGHSMFNIKDAPVASGVTMFTLGLVILLVRERKHRYLVVSVIALAVGVVVSMGSRPGIWIALAATSVIAIGLAFLLLLRTDGIRIAVADLGQQLVVLAIAVSLASFILFLLYPAAFSNAPRLLLESVATSQAFPWSGQTLTAGVQMPAQPPITYIPLWLSAQVPLAIALGALAGGIWVVTTLFLTLKRGTKTPRCAIGALPVLLQATLVPIGAVVLGSTLYGGLRQLLFVFPALGVLAVLGIRQLIWWVEGTERESLVRIAWVAIIVAIAIPLLSQIRLFPFSFAYFNAAASVRDINQNWNVDGWWLSGRELVEGEQFPARTICVDSEARFISSCSRMEMVTPFLGELGGGDIALEEDQYVALSRFPYNVGPDTCVPFREVTRGLYFQEIQLSHADICTSTLVALPEQGVSFSGLTKEDSVLLWGWNPYLLWGWGEPDADGVWMVEPEASIGFTVPVPSGDRTVEITGTGSPLVGEGASLRVFVNGIDAGTIPLPGAGQVQTSSVAVPQEAWSALDDGRVVVRLQAEGVDPAALKAAIDTGEPGLYRIESLGIP
ncbi:MAG TPA: hypothetical protein VGP34_02440, partial [Pontimonas sp.]|nr:hypothetical protein [Pontimonas sp.]